MNPTRHEQETGRNVSIWRSKPLLRDVYRHFHALIDQCIDHAVAGRIVEVGSGVGNFAEFRRDAVSTDRWLEPWLDVTCDAYQLPFRPGSVSHLILFDVFHHLSAPAAFLEEAGRVVAPRGRVILFEPFISAVSAVVYGLFHPEPIGWNAPIETSPSGAYYAAQGNATKLFFRRTAWLQGWSIDRRETYSSFAYLLSGGFSRPALYPRMAFDRIRKIDQTLSRFPSIFGARCLIVLERKS